MPQSKHLFASIIILLICFGTAASQSQASRATASDFNIEVLTSTARKHVFSIPEPPRRSGYERQQENIPAQMNFESWVKEMIETLGKMIPD